MTTNVTLMKELKFLNAYFELNQEDMTKFKKGVKKLVADMQIAQTSVDTFIAGKEIDIKIAGAKEGIRKAEKALDKLKRQKLQIEEISGPNTTPRVVDPCGRPTVSRSGC